MAPHADAESAESAPADPRTFLSTLSEAGAAKLLGLTHARAGLTGGMLLTIAHRMPSTVTESIWAFGVPMREAEAAAKRLLSRLERECASQMVNIEQDIANLNVIIANLRTLSSGAAVMTQLLEDERREEAAADERRRRRQQKRHKQKEKQREKQQHQQQHGPPEPAAPSTPPQPPPPPLPLLLECRMCLEEFEELAVLHHVDGTACSCVCTGCAANISTCLRCFSPVVFWAPAE